MRILHTSDWHIGQRLHERSREKEHKLFFEWLYNFINDNKIELLIVSGDIFDTPIPSNKSLKLYYNFLISLQNTECQSIIITAGNHDSPSTLEAPKEILNALNISVIGKVDKDIDNIIIQIPNSNIIVVAIPFLRDRDIREAIRDESFETINERYKKALIEFYNRVAKRCEIIKDRNSFIIAMGHLFATNTTISDSENTIYVGGLGDISSNEFPKIFNYIALGHLHKAQKVGGAEHIRYSGTPIPLSFNEAKRDSKVILLDNQSIQEITVPKFRDIISIKCSLDEVEERLKDIKQESLLTPWIEIIFTDNSIKFSINEKIERVAKDLDLKILKVSIENKREFNYLKEINHSISLSSLTPEDIFNKKCQEEEFDLESNSDVKDVFYEILSIIKEENS